MSTITNIKKKNKKNYINENLFKNTNIKKIKINKNNNNLYKKKNQVNQNITFNTSNKKLNNIKNEDITFKYANNFNTNFINQKRILIYENYDMHTEVMGNIIYNFLDYYIDIFHPHINSISNCIPYYEEILNKKINYVKEVNEDKYKIIIVLTSYELGFIKPKCINKYIVINHENLNINNNFYNISLTPLVRSDFYILPIYNYININHRENIICIIGSFYNHQQDFNIIHKLISNFPLYKIYIFTRNIMDNVKNSYSVYTNCIICVSTDTRTMINIIRKSKFIYTSNKNIYTELDNDGGRLTGAIPLGLNNNVPLIMTKRLNNIYNLTGVLLYENDFLELKEELLNLNEQKYNNLLEKSKNDNYNINMINSIKWDIIKNKF